MGTLLDMIAFLNVLAVSDYCFLFTTSRYIFDMYRKNWYFNKLLLTVTTFNNCLPKKEKLNSWNKSYVT